jgi:hypothetical protein
MGNLALSYLALERHDEALLTQQRVMQCREMTLNENDPEIGATLFFQCDCHSILGAVWFMNLQARP